jgi:O-antigen polysaccharide polymerase Wzy
MVATTVRTTPLRSDATSGIVLTAALALLLILHGEITSLSLERLSQLAVVLVLGCYVMIVRHSALKQWSTGAVFLLLLALFHLGLPFLTATHLPGADADKAYTALWFGGPFVPEAIYLTTLAAVSYTLCYLLAHGRRGAPVERETVAAEDAHERIYADVGLALVLAGVALYFGYVLATAGPDILLGGNYNQYLALLGAATPLAIATLAITFGLVFAAAAPDCRSRRAALLVFAGYALIILPLGVRTAVLFPAAAGVVAAARRHRLPSGRTTIAVVLLMLSVVGVVRQVRLTGFAAEKITVASVNPVAALSELGGTLRTVSETVSWQAPPMNEGTYAGITYVAPLLRMKERVLLQDPPVASEDMRLATSVMMKRSRPFQIGYSPIAEAYLNFGLLGVMGVFGLLGYALSRLDLMSRRSATASAVAGVVMAGIALTVRNGSNSIPTTIVSGLVLVFVTHKLSGAVSRSTHGLSAERDVVDRERAIALGRSGRNRG